MTASEFMRPAPRWITLPGDPAPLRHELAQLRAQDHDATTEDTP